MGGWVSSDCHSCIENSFWNFAQNVIVGPMIVCFFIRYYFIQLIYINWHIIQTNVFSHKKKIYQLNFRATLLLLSIFNQCQFDSFEEIRSL